MIECMIKNSLRSRESFISGVFEKWTVRYWLGGLILLSLGLRLFVIERDGVWFDEAISYLTATLSVPLILNNTVQSSHPPLYYLLLHYWLLWAPNSDIFLRLVSVFWGLLLLPATYWLTLELLEDRRLAIFAVVLITVSPWHILYSNELRMYTQQSFLIALAAGAYVKGRKTDRWRWWVLFGTVSLAALYTHLFTVFFLIAISIHALLERQNRRALWLTIGVVTSLAVLFLPWLAVLTSEVQAELGSLRPLMADTSLEVFNPVKLLTTLSLSVFGLPFGMLYGGTALFLSLALCVVTTLEVWKAERRESGSGLILPSLAILCIVGLPHIIYYARPFFLPERTMMAGLPFLMIFISWGATRHRTPLVYLSYASLIMMMIGTVLYLTSNPIKLPYRETMTYLIAEYEANDIIVHTSDFSYVPALRYTQLPKHVLLDHNPGFLKPKAAHEALGGDRWTIEYIEQMGGRVWLVVALVDNLEWQREQVSYFAANYVELDYRNVGGIELFLFSRRPTTYVK
jgi:uncharacterized membrane protein